MNPIYHKAQEKAWRIYTSLETALYDGIMADMSRYAMEQLSDKVATSHLRWVQLAKLELGI